MQITKNLQVIFLALIILMPIKSFSQYFVSGGIQARVIEDESGDQKIKMPLSIYAGMDVTPWAFAGEFLYYQNKSESSSTFKITEDHYELSAYVLRFFNFQEGSAINYYATGGFGTFKSQITTDFNGQQDKDWTDWNLAAKLGGGIWIQFLSKAYVNLEAKALLSNQYNPKALYEVGLRAGFKF